jgi:cellulose synthase/poly-beta-1,6-N-acetylglucosamine synthase-like glycosyltransferase
MELMQLALVLIFWGSVAVVAYVYVGFPLVLFLLARSRSGSAEAHESEPPRMTLLISAYNEEAVIRNKIDNALALDYPRERVEIIVISDCSNDGTDEIVTSYAGDSVCLVRQSERLGKSAGLNLGVSQASGEILIFSDANAIYQADAARQLVKHFLDPRVGYVVGNARYVEHAKQPAAAKSEGLYWKLETWLKEKESAFGSVVGGDGAIYAIRRELFTPLRGTDINDLLNPLQIIVRGYQGVYEPAAVCFEEAGDSFAKEFHRKVRIISRSLNALRRAPRVLLPWTQPRHWLALISHKVLRWFIPVFLFTAFLSTLCLWQLPSYRIALGVQLLFYAMATLGWAMEKRGTAPRILYLAYYFCLVNEAALFGIFKFFQGSLSPTWQTVREESAAKQVPAIPRNNSAS